MPVKINSAYLLFDPESPLPGIYLIAIKAQEY